MLFSQISHTPQPPIYFFVTTDVKSLRISNFKVFGSEGWATEILTMISVQFKCQFSAISEDRTNVYACMHAERQDKMHKAHIPHLRNISWQTNKTMIILAGWLKVVGICPWKKDVTLHLNKLEFPSTKDQCIFALYLKAVISH